MSNKKGILICCLILVIGFILGFLIIFFGNKYNLSQKERFLNGDYSKIYVNGINVDKDFVNNLYLDDYVIRFENDVVLLNYRG